MIGRRLVGPVAVLTIDRPHAANSLDEATRSAFAAALDDYEADDTTRAVVVTGAGERAFCAGMDLGDVPEHFDLDVDSTIARLARTPLPTVAAVNGAAVGGGFELALACDLVVAAEHARFWLPEVGRAIVPTEGGTRLAQRIPFAIAMEVVLTGARLDASRALALGLANRVVPSDDVVDQAVALATATCAGAPRAITWARQLVRRSLTDVADDLRTAEQDVTRKVLASDDVHEGARAFLEQRPPQWSGR